jgi:hypothetical protein
MAKASKKTAPKKAATKKSGIGRALDRARVAGAQDYEVDYLAEKTGRSSFAIKKAVKKVGNSRKKVTAVLKGSSRKTK